MEGKVIMSLLDYDSARNAVGRLKEENRYLKSLLAEKEKATQQHAFSVAALFDEEQLEKIKKDLSEFAEACAREHAYDSAHDLVISCPPCAGDIKRIIYNGAEISPKGVQEVLFNIEAPGDSRPNFRVEYQ